MTLQGVLATIAKNNARGRHVSAVVLNGDGWDVICAEAASEGWGWKGNAIKDRTIMGVPVEISEREAPHIVVWMDRVEIAL